MECFKLAASFHIASAFQGSGKSTLAKVLIGDSAYEAQLGLVAVGFRSARVHAQVTTGTAKLGETDLLDKEPHVPWSNPRRKFTTIETLTQQRSPLNHETTTVQ